MPITSNIQIAAPRDQVFGLFTDFASLAEHIEPITEIKMLTEGPVAVGTRFAETRIMFKKAATEEMEVTQFEPNERYLLEAQSCGAHYLSEYQFTEKDDKTVVKMTFNARPVSLFAKLMTPLSFLMKGMLQKCIDEDLQMLKKVAETKKNQES